MAFDGHANLRIVTQELAGLGERFASVRANVGFVEVEIGVADFPQEQFIEVRLRRFLHGRRRDTDVDARGGVCGATRAVGSDGVGGGIRRRHCGGAFGVDGADAWRDGELRRVRGGPGQRGGVTPVDRIRIGGKRHGRLSGRRRWSGSRRRSCRNGFLFAANSKDGGQQACHQQSAVQRTRDHSHSYPPQSYLESPCSTHRGEYRNTGGLVPGDISYHDIFYMVTGSRGTKIRKSYPNPGANDAAPERMIRKTTEMLQAFFT